MRTCRAHTRRLVMFSNKKTRNTHVQEAMKLTVSDADVASHELQTVLVDAVPSPPAARPDPTAQVLWATQGLRSFTLEKVGNVHAVQVMSVVAEPDGSTLPEPTGQVWWSWHALLDDGGLNEFGFVPLLHASHTVSALAVPATATPSPEPHVLWVLQPSVLVVEEKVLLVHAKHAPELNPSPGGQGSGAGQVDLKK